MPLKPAQRSALVQLMNQLNYDPSAAYSDSAAALKNRLFFTHTATPSDSESARTLGFIPKAPVSNPSTARADTLASIYNRVDSGTASPADSSTATRTGYIKKTLADPSSALSDSIASWSLSAMRGDKAAKKKLSDYHSLNDKPEKPKSPSDIVRDIKAKNDLDYYRKYGKWPDKPESDGEDSALNTIMKLGSTADSTSAANRLFKKAVENVSDADRKRQTDALNRLERQNSAKYLPDGTTASDMSGVRYMVKNHKWYIAR